MVLFSWPVARMDRAWGQPDSLDAPSSTSERPMNIMIQEACFVGGGLMILLASIAGGFVFAWIISVLERIA